MPEIICTRVHIVAVKIRRLYHGTMNTDQGVSLKKYDDELQVVYKPIPGYPGYMAGNDGTITSPRGAVMKSYKNPNGYTITHVRQNGKQRSSSTHKLVLLAHVGGRPEGCTGAHRNGIRDDNRLSNLYWATWGEQWADKDKHGTYQRGAKIGTAKLTEPKVREIKKLFGVITYSAIADRYGVSKSAIGQIASGRNWGHVV